MLYFAQFAPLSQTYDSSGDGSILISVNGEIHRAYPCFQVGEFDVPSRRFIETYRDKIGIWVTKTDDDKYVYLGFAWKNVNFNDLDSVPTKWMRLVKDTYENLTADYPYVRFKVSEDWLLIRSDGGDVTDFRVNNSFIFLKSASSRAELSISPKGIAVFDRLYEQEPEQQKREIRNQLVMTVDGVLLKDRNRNELAFYRELDPDTNHSSQPIYHTTIELNNYQPLKSRPTAQSILKNSLIMDKDGIELVNFQPPSQSSDSEPTLKNRLAFSKEGIELSNIFDGKIQLTENSVLIRFLKGTKQTIIKIMEDEVVIQFNEKDSLKINSDGLTYNGLRLVNEFFLRWLIQNASNFGLGNLGAPVPISPAALTKLVSATHAPFTTQDYDTSSFLTKPAQGS